MSELEAIPGAPAGFMDVCYILIGLMFIVGLPLFVAECIALVRAERLDRRRVLGILTCAFCFIPATLVEMGLGKELLEVLEALSPFAPWTIPTTWASALLCLLLTDFIYYWEHRAGHRIHLLWASYHSVHHSADHYDQSVGLRVSFMDYFFVPLFYLPLVVLGFHPGLVLLSLGIVLSYQQWIHTETVDKLPWLDPWLNTPSNHRVHHGRNEGYLDRNYGGVLIIWDRLFGSYAPEVEPVDYGLAEPLRRQDPLAVHFHSLGLLVRRMVRVRALREGLSVVFGPPEQSKV